MKILALDTSSSVATCAILDDNKLLGEYILNNKKTHSQKIMPMIKELFDSLDMELKDIDIYAASIGPGSFTGLRIGLATLKSLAHVNDKPVVGVPSMDALAYNLAFTDKLIVPIMDARRNRVYTGIYKWNNDKIETISSQDVFDIDELLDTLSRKDEDVIFSGDGVDTYKEKIMNMLKQKAFFAPSYLSMPRAGSVAYIALEKGKKGEVDNYFDIVPDYLRKSQAEREYEEKNNGEKNE